MQDILIHVRNFESRTPAAGFGLHLAARIGAAVTAVYAYPEPSYVAPAYAPELVSVIMENTRKLVQDAVQAKRAFVDWAASLGVARCEWLVAEGGPSDALTQAATRHDLMVLDHGNEKRGSPWDI